MQGDKKVVRVIDPSDRRFQTVAEAVTAFVRLRKHPYNLNSPNIYKSLSS